MTDPQIFRTAALVVSCALRDDDQGARLLLHTMKPEHILATCEASILAMAELVREFVPPHAMQAAINSAQELARTEATEGA
jgi:hypothetical protein